MGKTYEVLSQKLHDYETQSQDDRWGQAELYAQLSTEDKAVETIEPVLRELGL